MTLGDHLLGGLGPKRHPRGAQMLTQEGRGEGAALGWGLEGKPLG